MTMQNVQFDTVRATHFINQHKHPKMLGLQYHNHGPDWMELSLPWNEKLAGDESKVLASGPIISLFDMASGLAIWTTKQAFAPIATLELHVDYQRPARIGKTVIARVICYRMTNSAIFVRGHAHDGDAENCLATMSGIFMTLRADVGRADVGRADVGRADVGRADVGRADVGQNSVPKRGPQGQGPKGQEPADKNSSEAAQK